MASDTPALTATELAKLDAHLCEELDAGDPGALLTVTVSFTGEPPAAEELLPLGLSRLGDLVLGRVDRKALKTLAGRDDVRSIAGMGTSFPR